MSLFRKKKRTLDVIQVAFAGPGAYMVPFEGSDCGVVFEDSDDTGYLYVTSEAHDRVLVALHLYDYETPEQVTDIDEIYVVWNAALLRAGIHYRDRFQAVVDFANRQACCRSGFSSRNGQWCQSTLDWDDDLTDGLEFRVSLEPDKGNT